MKLFGILVIVLLSGCTDALEITKDMNPQTIWATGGFILLCCLGAGVVLNGWPAFIRVTHNHYHYKDKEKGRD